MPFDRALMNDLTPTPSQSERARFCQYLRSRREARDLSLDDISRITKIPERSLVFLERGEFEKLPADVFVRGFLRSYATCVGLDADETVRRYAACGLAPGPVATPGAHALVDPNAAPEPRVRSRKPATPEPEIVASTESIEPSDDTVRRESVSAVEPTERARLRKAEQREPSKRRRKKRKQRSKAAAANRSVEIDAEETKAAGPTEPSPEPTPAAPPSPTLVIDDDDPDAAEEVQVARVKGEERERDFSRRMFLPPVLLDPDQGSRRGALTLAVIILVIVATITMSYLLRRPSSSTDGVTQLEPSRGLTIAGEVDFYEA